MARKKIDGGPVRILLVEDDDDNRMLMAEVLSDAGYTVVAEGRPELALKRVKLGEFAAVITDVGLPGAGGMDFAKKVKSRMPDLPVLVVTGYDVEVTRGISADRVLLKPLDPDGLCAALREVIEAAPVRH